MNIEKQGYYHIITKAARVFRSGNTGGSSGGGGSESACAIRSDRNRPEPAEAAQSADTDRAPKSFGTGRPVACVRAGQRLRDRWVVEVVVVVVVVFMW